MQRYSTVEKQRWIIVFTVVLIQINDAKGLFQKLKDKCLLENHFFLSKLLHTIRREDLLSLLETDSRPVEETDAKSLLSPYR